MVKRIIKRDGRVVDFDRDKIQSAIMKAVEAVGGDDDVEASRVTDLVVVELSKCEEEPQVEYIQDLVEKMLIEEGHAATAKEYILYRANRDRVREMNSSLMRTFEELSFGSSNDVELKRENANIDGDTAMGTMLRYGSESAKQFNLSYLVSPDIAKAHRYGDIHIHDLDFMALTETCCQIDLEKLFKGGFNTGHGYLREPGEIRSYAALACIAIQGNQNEMHGGQSIPAFDHYMAPGVAKSFIKELKKVIDIKYPQCNYGKEMETDAGGYLTNEGIYQELKRYRDKNRLIMNEEGYEFIRGLFRDRYCKHIDDVNDIIKMASNLTDDATHQAMEAVIHNLNSMHVRQVQY